MTPAFDRQVRRPTTASRVYLLSHTESPISPLAHGFCVYRRQTPECEVAEGHGGACELHHNSERWNITHDERETKNENLIIMNNGVCGGDGAYLSKQRRKRGIARLAADTPDVTSVTPPFSAISPLHCAFILFPSVVPESGGNDRDDPSGTRSVYVSTWRKEKNKKTRRGTSPI